MNDAIITRNDISITPITNNSGFEFCSCPLVLTSEKCFGTSENHCNDCGCSHTFVYIHVVTVSAVNVR